MTSGFLSISFYIWVSKEVNDDDRFQYEYMQGKFLIVQFFWCSIIPFYDMIKAFGVIEMKMLPFIIYWLHCAYST